MFWSLINHVVHTFISILLIATVIEQIIFRKIPSEMVSHSINLFKCNLRNIKFCFTKMNICSEKKSEKCWNRNMKTSHWLRLTSWIDLNFKYFHGMKIHGNTPISSALAQTDVGAKNQTFSFSNNKKP